MNRQECAILWKNRVMEHVNRHNRCMSEGDLLQAREELVKGDMALCKTIRLMKLSGEPTTLPPPLAPLQR